MMKGGFRPPFLRFGVANDQAASALGAVPCA